MDIEVISAIITGVFGVIVSCITCNIANKTQLAVIEERINELSKKVDKHNQVVERTYKLETKVGVLEAKMEEN